YLRYLLAASIADPCSGPQCEVILSNAKADVPRRQKRGEALATEVLNILSQAQLGLDPQVLQRVRGLVEAAHTEDSAPDAPTVIAAAFELSRREGMPAETLTEALAFTTLSDLIKMVMSF